MHPTYPQNVLTLSREVDECTPLIDGSGGISTLLAELKEPLEEREVGRCRFHPIKPTLKAPETKRLKLKYEEMLSNLVPNSTCAATARCASRSRPRSSSRTAGQWSTPSK